MIHDARWLLCQQCCLRLVHLPTALSGSAMPRLVARQALLLILDLFAAVPVAGRSNTTAMGCCHLLRWLSCYDCCCHCFLGLLLQGHTSLLWLLLTLLLLVLGACCIMGVCLPLPLPVVAAGNAAATATDSIIRSSFGFNRGVLFALLLVHVLGRFAAATNNTSSCSWN